jgi:hypothetical protein
MFNAIINCHGLRELYLSGGQYTWSNNQQDPTLENLDRFLMNDAWETLFPLTTVHKLVREMSDHNPLILDTMEQKDKAVRDFKFKKAWLQEEDFMSRVSRAWQIPVRALDSMGKNTAETEECQERFERLGSKSERKRHQKKKGD